MIGQHQHTMASTIGTARGSTQGSWRPWASRVGGVACWVDGVLREPDRGRRLEGDAHHDRPRRCVMPPCTPPERLVRVRGRPSGPGSKASLCSIPVRRVPAKPLPISKPLAAGSEISAFASSASSLSKTGSPSPAGRGATTHSTTPPSESPSAARGVDGAVHLGRCRGIRAAHRVGLDRVERHACSGRPSPRCRARELTHASTSTPHRDAQQLARDRAGGDASDRLAGARPAAALPVADAVLGLVGVVGVRRAVDVRMSS